MSAKATLKRAGLHLHALARQAHLDADLLVQMGERLDEDMAAEVLEEMAIQDPGLFDNLPELPS